MRQPVKQALTKELITLYVGEHCVHCEGAAHAINRVAREYGLSLRVHSTDQHPVEGLPAVPAVLFRGVIYVGANWERRIRLALTDPKKLCLTEHHSSGAL